MKKLIGIAILIMLCSVAKSQVFADVSAGFSAALKPAGIVSIGYSGKLGEAAITANYPFMYGAYYGYRIKDITPYIGFGSQGVFGGLKATYNQAIAFDARVSKDAVILAFG
jgi:hypothetical protein